MSGIVPQAVKDLQRLQRQLSRPTVRDRAAERTARLPEYPASIWSPIDTGDPDEPSPQQQAYDSPADEIYFGGGAGGGKSDLLLGLGLKAHRKSIVFRRTKTQVTTLEERLTQILNPEGGDAAGYNLNMHRLVASVGGVRRRLTLAGMQREKDWQNYQGQPNDLVGFDELPHFLRSQFRAIVGWNRTSVEGQRARVVGAGNPPVRPEEMWVIDEFAPWLDPDFQGERAVSGELRWYYYLAGKPEGQDILWLTHDDLTEDDDGRLWFVPDAEDLDPATGEPVRVYPMSRTFILALVDDNPHYMATGYADRLNALPEPLRSLMRRGAFDASVQDDPWQVIPTAWVDAAQARWQALHHDADGNPVDYRPGGPLTALGVDPARGGKDAFTRAPRWGDYFGEVLSTPGGEVPDGPTGAALVLSDLDGLWDDGHATDGALVVVDVIGVGGGVWDALVDGLGDVDDGGRLAAFVASGKSARTDRTGRLPFVNARAELWWRFREALDPKRGAPDGGPSRICLPPSRTLRSQLCAPRWRKTASGILVEPKVNTAAPGSTTWGVKNRLGTSTDEADAVLHATYDPPPPEKQSAFIDADDWGTEDGLPAGVILTDWDWP